MKLPDWVNRSAKILLLAVLLAYVVPFSALGGWYGLSLLKVHQAKARGEWPCGPLEPGLVGRAADVLYRVFYAGKLPGRMVLFQMYPPSSYPKVASSVKDFYLARYHPDSVMAMGYPWDWEHLSPDLVLQLVTLVCWVVVLAFGRYAWHRLVGPSASFRRRVWTLWWTGWVLACGWVTVVLWRTAAGRPEGPWSRLMVVGVPVILVGLGVLAGVAARREGGSVPAAVVRAVVLAVALIVGVAPLVVGGGWRLLHSPLDPNEMLRRAAVASDVADVRRALELGADIGPRDSLRKTPFMEAVVEGHRDICKLLLERGADVNGKDVDQEVPLMWAAGLGRPELCRLLLDHGAEVDAKNEDGETPLMMAAEQGRHDICELLIARGADVNVREKKGKTALHVATENNHPEVIRTLLKLGADVNARDNKGKTPLHVAAANSDPELIRTLVELGADVNARDKHGGTPLHEAADNNNPEEIRTLVELGADVNARDNKGETPLHVAAANGNPEVIRALVKLGADIDARKEYGKTPLHVAARYPSNPAVIRTLVKLGAEVNARDQNGWTPLHVAAHTNAEPKVVLVLLELGADPRALTNHGLDALDLLQKNYKLRNTSGYQKLEHVLSSLL